MITTHPKPLPPIKVLAENVYIDPSSPSGLRWKVSKSCVRAGDVAGSLRLDGYWYVKISGQRMMAHRAVYAIAHNVDPGNLQIDHIDRERGNNRIENLRLVDQSTNLRNTLAQKDNKLGVKGVCWCEASSKFRANIGINGKKIHLGYFETIAEATAARQAAEIYYDVHTFREE